jgi:AcrR family transcriptional regulator
MTTAFPRAPVVRNAYGTVPYCQVHAPTTAGRSRDEARATILATIADLLREGGYGRVTIDAIAARARMSKSTIYRYWPTKRELLIAAAAQEFPAISVDDRGDFRAELTAYFDARLAQYRQPGAARLLSGIIGAAAEDDAMANAVRTWVKGQLEGTAAIIRRAVERGEISRETDVAQTCLMLAAPWLFRLVMEQGIPDRRFMEALLNHVERALRR